MSTITVSLNDINKAISDVKAYARMVEEAADEICKRVATQMQFDAEAGFSQFEERSYVTVSDPIPNDTGDGYKVSASGYKTTPNGVESTVLFEEFGAGFTTGEGNPHAAEVGAVMDSYSESHAQWFHLYEYWWYDHKRMDSVNGTNAMYNAALSARENVYTVANQVFSERSIG